MVKNSSVAREYELKHTVAFLDSVKAEKARISKRRQWVRRIVFGGLAAGAFGGGLYMNAQAADAADAYHASQSYNTAVHGNNGDEYESNALTRNVLCGIAAAFAAGCVLSIPY